MKFGLNEEDYQFIRDHLEVLEKVDLTAQIWVFGSRARGDYKPFSDLDLMIESDQDLSARCGELSEIFTKSNLPIKIDLVQKSDFAESFKPSYLKDRKLF